MRHFSVSSELQQVQQLFNEDFEALRKIKSEEKPKAFICYCNKIIQAQRNATISIMQAAFQIARAHELKELYADRGLKDIVNIAGLLEIPPQHVNGNPQELWDTLVHLVYSVKKRRHSNTMLPPASSHIAKRRDL